MVVTWFSFLDCPITFYRDDFIPYTSKQYFFIGLGKIEIIVPIIKTK